MSYDRIWIDCRKHPGGWLERSAVEDRGGHLVASKSCAPTKADRGGA
jgi:hypothetical protein